MPGHKQKLIKAFICLILCSLKKSNRCSFVALPCSRAAAARANNDLQVRRNSVLRPRKGRTFVWLSCMRSKRLHYTVHPAVYSTFILNGTHCSHLPSCYTSVSRHLCAQCRRRRAVRRLSSGCQFEGTVAYASRLRCSRLHTWTRRAANSSARHLDDVQSGRAFKSHATYSRVVLDLNRLLEVSSARSKRRFRLATTAHMILSPCALRWVPTAVRLLSFAAIRRAKHAGLI